MKTGKIQLKKKGERKLASIEVMAGRRIEGRKGGRECGRIGESIYSKANTSALAKGGL